MVKSLFKSFRNLFQTKRDIFTRTAFVTFIQPGEPVWTKDDFQALATNGYSANSFCFASVNLVMNSVSSVKWNLFRRKRDGEKEEVEVNPLIDLLKNPNPVYDGLQFLRWVTGYFEMSGNAYIWLNIPSGTEPTEMWFIRPDLITPIAGTLFSPVQGYKLDLGNGRSKVLKTEEVIHMRNFNPLNPYVGLSPDRVAAKSIDQNNEGKAWNVAMLQNKAVPSGGLTTEGDLTDEQREDLKREMKEKWSGKANAGKPILLEGGLKWNTFAMKPTDMEWEKSQKMSAKEIAITHQIPPEMLGDSENKTYSNYQEARRAFYNEKVLPLLDLLQSTFNKFLVPLFGEDLFIEYDKDNINALQEDQNQLYERVQKSNFITQNEKREMVGFEEYEGGDVMLIPSSLIPVTMAGQQDQTDEPDDQGEPMDEEDENKEFTSERLYKLNAVLKKTNKVEDGLSEESREFIYKAVNDKRDSMFKQVTGIIEKRHEEERKAVLKSVESTIGIQTILGDADKAINDQEPEMMKTLEELYVVVAKEFGSNAIRGLKSTVLNDFELKQDEFDYIAEETRSYLQSPYAASMVKGISDTKKKMIRTHILDGISEGEGIRELSKRIDTLYLEQIIPNRSSVIARTETIRASNLGSQAGAKSTGLALKKEWIATLDARTREEHLSVNKQTVPMSEPYTVAGEKMMFPGDVSLGASAGNVIQCRCTEGYIPI